MSGDLHRPRIGVLALQGDFAAHLRMLGSIGSEAVEVRRVSALDRLDGLIIPGGESTTLLRSMQYEPEWWPALERFRGRGGAIFGTCAGLILLAREVARPEQRSLGFLDVSVERNSYGRQVDSFESTGRWSDGRELEMVFIRAPRITRIGPAVETLARLGGTPVLVREATIIGASFHAELTRDGSVHRLFLGIAGGAPRPETPAAAP